MKPKYVFLTLFSFSLVLTPALSRSAVYPIDPKNPSQGQILAANTITGPDAFLGYPLLKRIASCESWGDPNQEPREFKDGQVLRGFPNPQDVGLAQINLPTWGDQAKKLGYDLMTYDGNLAFAK